MAMADMFCAENYHAYLLEFLAKRFQHPDRRWSSAAQRTWFDLIFVANSEFIYERPQLPTYREIASSGHAMPAFIISRVLARFRCFPEPGLSMESSVNSYALGNPALCSIKYFGLLLDEPAVGSINSMSWDTLNAAIQF